MKIMPQKNELFVFAGEQSGDLLGGKLLVALQELLPDLPVYGVGGSEMIKAGLKVLRPIEAFQVMGFIDVLKALPRLYQEFRLLKKEILQRNPKCVLLIDYADFNMLLAKALKKNGYQGKIIHYVCPSVWAWRKKRIHSLSATLDELFAILPFEKECFSKTSLRVSYVGHPLVAAIDQHAYKELSIPSPLIALFPGSRRQEILSNLPLQLAAAKKLNLPIAISVARPSLLTLIQKYAPQDALLIPCEERYELMRHATGAIATSGTITLELGLHNVPTVITYKLSYFNYLLGRYLFRIRLPFYTLVNIICGKEVYPEFIHKKLDTNSIALKLKKLIDSSSCQQECTQLRTLLTTADASKQAALLLSQHLSS